MRERKAFTLVELLVVIGIIAVLVGILLPTLAGARRAAMAARCAVSLRELGNAVHMYANEFKGYIPPWRAGCTPVERGSGVIYHIAGIDFGSTTFVPGKSSLDSAYWYNFLSKYLSKYGGGTSHDASNLEEFKKSPVWGCPAFTGFPDTQHAEVTTEFNPLLSGYAWNPHPGFTVSYPALGVDRPSKTFRPDNNIGRCGVSTSKAAFATYGWSKPYVFSGPWFKITQYTRPAERGLIADAEAWILEAKAPPLSGQLPGQKLHYGKPDFAPAAAGAGATTFDWYRHGKPPGVEVMGGAGYFKSTGGRVSYNILYVDGHVERAIDRQTSYRAVRMRYPG